MRTLSILIGVVIGALFVIAWFCPPTPTPSPTATAEIPPTVTLVFTDTPVPVPTVTEDLATPTPIPVATPTVPASTVTLQPSQTPSKVPGITFTITSTTTIATKEPQGKDTPTPTKKVYYTWVPPATKQACGSGECSGIFDTDTILNNDDLRVRIINNGVAQANLQVLLELVGTSYKQELTASPFPGRTGEVVFTVPCFKEATFIKLTIGFPGYTATEMIAYPDCICQGK